MSLGALKRLPSKRARQHFDFSVLQGAGHAAFAEFAGVEAAFGVVGVADDAAGAFGEYGIASAGSELAEFVDYGVAEQQIAVVGPHGAFGEMQVLRYALDFHVAEVLGEGGGGEQ